MTPTEAQSTLDRYMADLRELVTHACRVGHTTGGLVCCILLGESDSALFEIAVGSANPAGATLYVVPQDAALRYLYANLWKTERARERHNDGSVFVCIFNGRRCTQMRCQGLNVSG
jgi:hypothetical protein